MTLAIRTTVVPIRILIRTTVVPIRILIRTTFVPIRILIGTTGITNALCEVYNCGYISIDKLEYIYLHFILI